MAYKGKIITSKSTGQSIRFLQTAKDTGGAMIEMESTYSPRSKKPAEHYHPYQEESFTIIRGVITLRLSGKIKIFCAGDTFTIPRNTVHAMWNESDSPTIMNWKMTPAMDTEYFLETALGIAAEGKADEKGLPDFLQIALTASKYHKTFRLAKPPFVVQKLVFSMLTPFAYLAGYRPVYKKYID